MIIEKDKVVQFHYRLSEAGNENFEDSHSGDPIAYLHGHNGMLPGLEAAMAGKQAGDNFSITLEPEKAYGLRHENAIQRVSPKHIYNPQKKKINYKPGMVIQLNTSHGLQDVVVVKAGLKSLDVDINHPLAGKTLTFDIEIVDVRDASDEEIAHGHAHGVGGHHH